ncbi:MAG: WYL domain-containing protein [Ktedonobacteraceae bacterium]|nr:WYL domain-containing protein [Ktedonobacteraceae bacterium]
MKSDTPAKRAERRRLALLALLHRRPHSSDEIVAELDRADLFVYDSGTAPGIIVRQQRDQFHWDRKVLRRLGCQITYDRHSKCYTWQNSPFGLSLAKEHLGAFALLLDTFAESTLLHASDIQALLTFLVERLPPEQQKIVTGQQGAFHIDLHETTDYRKADPLTIRPIEMAIEHRQRLEFQYRSRDGQERTHVIEPRPLTFKHGHVYLDGWSIDGGSDLRFRLDYIIPGSAHMLHEPFMRNRRPPRSYPLHYRLNAVIARHSVSEHFPGQEVERYPDGSATVTAQISDLFEARRLLLSYGKNCTVLEPPELVAEMRDHAVGLYEIYHT